MQSFNNMTMILNFSIPPENKSDHPSHPWLGIFTSKRSRNPKTTIIDIMAPNL